MRDLQLAELAAVAGGVQILNRTDNDGNSYQVNVTTNTLTLNIQGGDLGNATAFFLNDIGRAVQETASAVVDRVSGFLEAAGDMVHSFFEWMGSFGSGSNPSVPDHTY
jgi:hypothetical protein